MSVRGTLGGILASAVVLIIGWQVGAEALAHQSTTTSSGGTSGTGGTSSSGAGGTGSTSSTGSSGGTGSTSSSGSSGGTGSSGGSSGTSALTNGVYTGTKVSTRYGEIEVQVTVAGGKITDVTTPVLQAFDGRSQQINSQAVPLLKQEVLSAQSAHVDMISGATYTSDGYLTSLQAALDKAE